MSSQEACPRVPGVAFSAWRCGAHCGRGAQQCRRQGDLSPSLTHGCGSAVTRGPLFYPPAKAQGLCAYVWSVSLEKALLRLREPSCCLVRQSRSSSLPVYGSVTRAVTRRVSAQRQSHALAYKPRLLWPYGTEPWVPPFSGGDIMHFHSVSGRALRPRAGLAVWRRCGVQPAGVDTSPGEGVQPPQHRPEPGE